MGAHTHTHTHAPPKHCAGLSNNKGPHTRMCLIIGPVRINHARREGRGKKKEGEAKLSEAFNKRVQGGGARARPARPPT